MTGGSTRTHPRACLRLRRSSWHPVPQRPTSAAWFRLAVVGTVLLMAAWIAVVALLSWWVITRLLG
jgi:hypothetical protein